MAWVPPPPRTGHPSFMYEAIHAHPEAIRRALHRNPEVLKGAAAHLKVMEQVFLAGIGTSWHACLVGELLLARTGRLLRPRKGSYTPLRPPPRARSAHPFRSGTGRPPRAQGPSPRGSHARPPAPPPWHPPCRCPRRRPWGRPRRGRWSGSRRAVGSSSPGSRWPALSRRAAGTTGPPGRAGPRIRGAVASATVRRTPSRKAKTPRPPQSRTLKQCWIPSPGGHPVSALAPRAASPRAVFAPNGLARSSRCHPVSLLRHCGRPPLSLLCSLSPRLAAARPRRYASVTRASPRWRRWRGMRGGRPRFRDPRSRPGRSSASGPHRRVVQRVAEQDSHIVPAAPGPSVLPRPVGGSGVASCPDAAGTPSACPHARGRRAYQPRAAERSVLHPIVRDHLETLLREAAHRAEGAGWPDFVAQAFHDVLPCGVLAHGFARVRGGTCAFAG